LNRKDFLKWLGVGSAGAVAGGGLLSVFRRGGSTFPTGYGSSPASNDPTCLPGQSDPVAQPGTSFQPTYQSSLGPAQPDPSRGLDVIGNSYGSMVHPPAALGGSYLAAFERKPVLASLAAISYNSRATGSNDSGMARTDAGPNGAEVGSNGRKKPAVWNRKKENGIQYTALSTRESGLLPPLRAPTGIREFTVDTIERPLNVAHGTIFNAWTFNGTVPGPVVRATEGETLKINFRNLTSEPHSLHFHGTHDVNFDGWEPIPAGKSTEYIIKAGPAGVHPYHCHTAPIAAHIAKGLFGALIVDPAPGRPPAREVVLILHGYDLSGRGRNDLFCWNGIAGYYSRYPIKVKVNELVRLYVVNMVEYDPIASFHLHAQTFDVYRTGTRMTPDEHTDVVTLGQTERVVLEMRFPRKGRYMFHPHQSYMAEKGAMGWIVAV